MTFRSGNSNYRQLVKVSNHRDDVQQSQQEPCEFLHAYRSHTGALRLLAASETGL